MMTLISFFLLVINICSHVNAAVVTIPIDFLCPKCGAIQKSGRLSCCGHGGSWFENCGNARSANVDHTWVEGIWACKRRHFKAVVSQQSHAFQPRDNASSDIASMEMKSKVIAVAAHMFLPSSTNATIITPGATPALASPDTPMTMRSSTFLAHGAERTVSKMLSAASTVSVHTSANMTDSIKESITNRTNLSVEQSAATTTIKPMLSVSVNMPTRTSSYTSSTSILALASDNVFSIVNDMGMIMIILYF